MACFFPGLCFGASEPVSRFNFTISFTNLTEDFEMGSRSTMSVAFFYMSYNTFTQFNRMGLL